MGNNDHNVTSEQKRPADVNPTPDDVVAHDGNPLASTFVKPADERDADDRPVVNPVTGAAF